MKLEITITFLTLIEHLVDICVSSIPLLLESVWHSHSVFSACVIGRAWQMLCYIHEISWKLDGPEQDIVIGFRRYMLWIEFDNSFVNDIHIQYLVTIWPQVRCDLKAGSDKAS